MVREGALGKAHAGVVPVDPGSRPGPATRGGMAREGRAPVGRERPDQVEGRQDIHEAILAATRAAPSCSRPEPRPPRRERPP